MSKLQHSTFTATTFSENKLLFIPKACCMTHISKAY